MWRLAVGVVAAGGEQWKVACGGLTVGVAAGSEQWKVARGSWQQ
jgi:hypothetical protein